MRERGLSPEEMGIKPEQKGQNVEVAKQTESGLWLRRVEKDDQGRVLFEEVRDFEDNREPNEGDAEKFRYEKRYELDEEGQITREKGKSASGTEWNKQMQYEEGRLVKEMHENTSGASRGRKLEKMFEYDDEGRVVKETGVVLEQGDDPSKSPAGSTWEKDHKSSY